MGRHVLQPAKITRAYRYCTLVCGALIVASSGAGCKKNEAPSAGNAVSSSAAPASPRGPGWSTNTATPIVIAASGDVNAMLDQLSAELRKYVLRSRSVPKNFEEFAAKSMVQAPEAPAGKKYAIKGQVIVLVNR